ncbi:MAG: GEVED domain-containing protein [Planctomycetota bacterium]
MEVLECRRLLAADIRMDSNLETHSAAETIEMLPAHWWSFRDEDRPVRLGPKRAGVESLEPGPVHLRALEYQSVVLQIDPLRESLLDANQNESLVLAIPRPDGLLESFEIQYDSVMATELASRYESIRTFSGRSADSGANVRLDVTPAGFHAIVISPEGNYYIDPLYHGDDVFYASYFTGGDFSVPEFDEPGVSEPDAFEPSVSEAFQKDGGGGKSGTGKGSIGKSGTGELASRSGTQLRTYRAAIAANGEYTTFHGGTVELGLAAVVTAINRVNAVYENELSIRFELIAENDQIIYTNSATDPYTNAVNGGQLNTNQDNLDAVIGSANYDVGHLFVTGGGGVAGLGVAGIDGFKARGMTGLPQPIGDVFFIDFVAHEIGHQYGGSHTFNGDSGSCAGGNRSAAAAFEPGSGSTIQAYAGICGNDNLQNNSDAYFHSASFDQMIDHVDNRIPTVGSRTATGNNVPQVDGGADFVIPARTPFLLTASGSDADAGDVLTYNWEQRDLGPQQDVNAGDNGSSPIFRSFQPTTDPTRIFPRLSDLLVGTTVIGETLPTTTRELNFRVTVRDNASGGGGVNSDDVLVNVIDTGEAFEVISFNGGETVAGLSTQTVTWNVAGTSANGIDATNVDIELSTDGGLTYDVTLLAATDNDGSADVVIPNIPGSDARLRIKASDGIFFDISDADFEITAAVFSTDFGDAPDGIDGTPGPYRTLASSGGAVHNNAGTDLFLGSIVDTESDGQPDDLATGDGIDEDGVRFTQPFVAGQTVPIEVTASGAGVLDFFLDFDGAGGFGNVSNEVFSANVLAGTQTIPVTIPAGVSGNTFARFRLTSGGGVGPAGPANGGEVEDYRVQIFATAPPRDFGDAPAVYGTLAADAGAAHLIKGPTLGAGVSDETDGLASANATGDADDGVQFLGRLIPGLTTLLRITTVGGGTLDFFFDFDGDGVFGNTSDEVFRETVADGTQTLSVNVPETATAGITFARFRLSSVGVSGPGGLVSDGEVEDYQVVISDPTAGEVLVTDFDDVTVPLLPPGWTTSSQWATVGSNSSSQPNHAFVPNQAQIRDDRLTSPPQTIGEGWDLSFRNLVNAEAFVSGTFQEYYDGAVLEIKIGNDDFMDILDAGGVFLEGGYNAVIEDDFGNPLGGRAAWSGNLGGYFDTVVDLPDTADNQSVQLRWRFGSDISFGAVGQRIDDVMWLDPSAGAFDFGDAPDPPYASSAASGGAAHVVTDLHFGAGVTAEEDALQNAGGDGDADDGITIDQPWIAGGTTTLSIQASQDAIVSAWVDWNGDGVWSDDESISRDLSVVSGSNDLEVSIPQTANIGFTFARFRISNQAGLAPTGEAADGEVEDLQIVIEAGVAPVIEDIIVNGNEVQRSRIDGLEIRFDQEITLDTSDGGPFQIESIDSGETVAWAADESVVDGKSIVTLTFLDGIQVTDFGSLTDGRYRLTVRGDKISAGSVLLDGDDDGVAGGDRIFDDTDGFFRLYGDTDGNRTVNLFDFADFRSAFGFDEPSELFRPEWDANGDGSINLLDFADFRTNFGRSV